MATKEQCTVEWVDGSGRIPEISMAAAMLVKDGKAGRATGLRKAIRWLVFRGVRWRPPGKREGGKINRSPKVDIFML